MTDKYSAQRKRNILQLMFCVSIYLQKMNKEDGHELKLHESSPISVENREE